MKGSLLAAAALLLVVPACDGDDVPTSAEPTAPATSTARATSAPATATAAPPTRVGVRPIASQPVPTMIQGVQLFSDHVAYVEEERQLVWMSWRTGDRETVARSQYGSFYLLGSSGRYCWIVDQPPGFGGDDPSSPRRWLELDLATGHVRRTDYPQHGRFVAEMKDGGFILVVRRQRPDGRETGRSDLVHDNQLVSSSGRVVQAAYDLHHRVVWTEWSKNGDADPHWVWTADLDHPEQPPQQLFEDLESAPFDPVIGDGYVGWTEYGERLSLMPVGGGPVTRLPGRVANVAPSAYGRIVAVVMGHRGHPLLEVLRVDP